MVDDGDIDMDCDLSRAIAASLADATHSAAKSHASPRASSSSSTGSSDVICLIDVDEDECREVEPFVSSSLPFPSVPHLPPSPSRWDRLPIDLLALISTFQFGGCPRAPRAASASAASHSRSLSHTSSQYGVGAISAISAHASVHHGRSFLHAPHASIAQQPAHWPNAWYSSNGVPNGQADDSLLSVHLLLTMSTVCRHWHRIIQPSVHHFKHHGCREVDCWSGVQQVKMRMSGRYISVGGVRVKRKRIARVLASLSCLRSICLEFNVHPTAMDECDFDLLLPGSSVVHHYRHLQQLSIRLVEVYEQPHPSAKQSHRPRSSHHQRNPAQQLYSKLSTWLNCHPKLRSFTLIDPHSTPALPYAPPGFAPMATVGGPPIALPPPPLMGAFGVGAIQPLFPPLQFIRRRGNMAVPILNPLLMQAYRAPSLPQPSAASLRMLCTGRLRHLAVGGETLVRLAYGQQDEKKDRAESKPRLCFQADEVQSISLLGDWQQPRFFDALLDALPSLSVLTLSHSQSKQGADAVLSKVGHRIAVLRCNVNSLAAPSQPATFNASCSALQSLYINVHIMSPELADVYAVLPSLPQLTQLSVVEPTGGQYPNIHNLPPLSLPPLPELLYLHLQLSSYRVFPLLANRDGATSAILPAKLQQLLLRIPGQQLVPHLSSVPRMCPKLMHCHISSGASVTSQTWETRLGRLKARLRGVWRESESEVTRHRMDVAWRADMDLKVCPSETYESEAW